MDSQIVVERSRAQLALLRINPGAVARVKVVAGGPAWFQVHWVGKRQVLCCSDGGSYCPACAIAPGRVIGFVLCTTLLGERERLFLLEVSPLAISSMEMSAKFEGLSTSDSLWCDVTRPGSRRPLRFEAIEASGITAPESAMRARLINAVAVLFGLPLMRVEETVEAWEERVRGVVASFAARAVKESATRTV